MTENHHRDSHPVRGSLAPWCAFWPAHVMCADQDALRILPQGPDTARKEITMAYATIADRLAANSKTNKKTGCREWTGNVNNSGYARYSIRCGTSVQKVYAYRTVWELKTGKPIPEGLEIDHKCSNTRCINPAHLQVVTGERNRELAVQRARRAA